MTVLVAVLAAITVVALFVWWLNDFDMPEIVVPVAAPGAGALLIYWYGTPLAWAIGIALFAIAGAAAYVLVRRSRSNRADPPK